MEYLKGVGLRISTLRKSQGITQEGLAQMVGYTSRSSINKIERGLVDLPQSKIKDIAKALGTTPTYIMGIEEENPTAMYDGISEKRRELIEFAMTVPEEKAEMILRVMKSIVEAD
jgi:transcriptional regulator with XRE-family HTH domain